MGMTQLKHSMIKIVVHLGRETLVVTKTGEALLIEETLGGGYRRGYRGNSWRGQNNGYQGGYNGGCGQRWNDFHG